MAEVPNGRDSDLARALIDGCRASHASLYESYSQKLTHHAGTWRNALSMEDAEDVVATFFTELLENPTRYLSCVALGQVSMTAALLRGLGSRLKDRCRARARERHTIEEFAAGQQVAKAPGLEDNLCLAAKLLRAQPSAFAFLLIDLRFCYLKDTHGGISQATLRICEERMPWSTEWAAFEMPEPCKLSLGNTWKILADILESTPVHRRVTDDLLGTVIGCTGNTLQQRRGRLRELLAGHRGLEGGL